VGHDENFPVASWLCPPELRPPITAIYHFARTADDIADEGEASAADRLSALAHCREALDAAFAGQPQACAWPAVFGPLAHAIRAHALPPAPLHDLLSAFEQDVVHTANAHRYADRAELLAYCSLSANPIGRLLLHLYGEDENAEALAESDAICSGLQLVNFWQDISRDVPRRRHYLPLDTLARHGLQHADVEHACARPLPPQQAHALSAALADECAAARALLLAGAPLVRRLPGRVGWELRLVVAGALRVLDKLAATQYRSWAQRPALAWTDAPAVLGLAWTVGRSRHA
jgi:squalene synthase HpnC